MERIDREMGRDIPFLCPSPFQEREREIERERDHFPLLRPTESGRGSSSLFPFPQTEREERRKDGDILAPWGHESSRNARSQLMSLHPGRSRDAPFWGLAVGTRFLQAGLSLLRLGCNHLQGEESLREGSLLQGATRLSLLVPSLCLFSLLFWEGSS